MIGVAKNPNELPGSAIDMKLASYRRSITFGTSVSCASDAVPNRRHSVQRTPLPLPALRRNWFSQLYFHFHFSLFTPVEYWTIYKYNKIHRQCSG